ncbi:MAG: hypothetical protein AAFO58_12760, partial [Pseudomonadota bacterium]
SHPLISQTISSPYFLRQRSVYKHKPKMAIRTYLLLAVLINVAHLKIVVVDNLDELFENRKLSETGFQLNGEVVGYQLDRGLMWSVICDSPQHGKVPGKLDADGNAHYAWGGKEWGCQKHSKPLKGRRVLPWRRPASCKAQGRQFDSGDVWAGLILSEHGMVPGKVNGAGTMAWYCWGGKEIYVRDRFWYIC